MLLEVVGRTSFYSPLELKMWASLAAQMVKNLPANAEDMGLIPGLDPWVRKIPRRKAWQPTVVLLPGESHGQGEPGRL